MPNFNDAEITRLYVSEQTAPTVQDDAPNAPGGGPFNVTIEMVAGTGMQSEAYTLTWGCFDWTAGGSAPAALTAGLPTSGNFDKAGWSPTPGGTWFTYTDTVTVNPPAGGGQNHLYQYSVALKSDNGQATSFTLSDPFLLI